MHYVKELKTEEKLYFKDNKCQKCNTIYNVDTNKRKHLFFNHTKYVEIIMNEVIKAMGVKVTARDNPSEPTKYHTNERVVPLSILGSPSNMACSLESDSFDESNVSKEELVANDENLLKSDDEETNHADTGGDMIKNAVDETRNVDNWHINTTAIKNKDEEVNECFTLEEIDHANLAEMDDSDLNKRIDKILGMDERGVKRNTKRKDTEYLEETIEGGDVIQSIQEHLLLMQNFSDDDEDKEDEDKIEEFEDEDVPGENGTNTALDGKDEEDQSEDVDDNEDTTENHQEICEGVEEEVEDSFNDIMNMELPEDEISDNEHDDKWEEIHEDLENSADISGEELQILL